VVLDRAGVLRLRVTNNCKNWQGEAFVLAPAGFGNPLSRLCARCRAVWLRVRWLVRRLPQARLAATERAAFASEVPPADLSLGIHGTRQSATTRRKSGRISGGA
jgi:hypothetical protein